LDGREVGPVVNDAAVLLATVLGQDLETTDGGVFRIARRVAKDRVISIVDPQARHCHKTQARGFDGYNGHFAVDPESEIITDTEVSTGNVGDAAVATDLIVDLLDTGADTGDDRDGSAVYGDSAYGSGQFQDTSAGNDIASRSKTQPTKAPAGRLAKDQFAIDLDRDTVTCPAAQTTTIRRGKAGDGIAYFGDVCSDCPLRAQCTNAAMAALSPSAATSSASLTPGGNNRTRPGRLPRDQTESGTQTRSPDAPQTGRTRSPDAGTSQDERRLQPPCHRHNLARLAVLQFRSAPTGWPVATA